MVCLLALMLGSGCGLVGLIQNECSAPVVQPPDEPLLPISQAVRYLSETQFQADRLVAGRVEYAGDWPQCMSFRDNTLLVRETSPFMATFIHRALTYVVPEHQQALGLSDADIRSAREMRTAAVDLMLRFQAGPDTADAGAFGFWPYQRRGWLPGDGLLSAASILKIRGPRLWGHRAPVNISFFPRAWAIPADADDTAAIYAALLDHMSLDDGPEVVAPFERLFVDWRDLGQVTLRNNEPWLPRQSGAFLTWLAYNDDPAKPRPNDVDLVVNANVLYALGRYGLLETPGVSDAVALINAAVQPEAMRSHPDQMSLYYPDNLSLHYCVTRAYREGEVRELAPAVEVLVADLLATVEQGPAGRYYWDRGHPHLSTAFAVLTLLNAGQEGDLAEGAIDRLVEGAIDYLISEQNPSDGSWEEGTFFRTRSDGGTQAVWVSRALTTAIALEALFKYSMAAAETAVEE